MWRVWVLVLSILVWSSDSVNGNTNTNDSSALRVMYSSLNSPSQLTGWSSNNGGDPCGQSWKGVTCSGSAVTEIKLSGLGLSGTLGYQLSSLSSLTILDVSNNNLGNQLPYQLPPNVQQLNFARNSFSGGLPYSISSMTSLKYLNISHNQINGQLDDMFGQLSAITTLDFSYNTLTGNLPQSFSSLSSVTTMNLQNNQFTGPINVLANLPLQYLNVQNNGFSGWIPNSLKHVPNFYYGGNPWSNGPAPPPPPYTSPPSRHSNTNSPPSNGGNSGIGGGGIAGIVISVLVVGAVVAFFLVKKRSRRTVSDVEKLDNDRPFTPLVSDNVKEVTEKSIPPSSITDSKAVETSALNLRPPPIKSFDEDDLTIKPIVVNKATTTPINAKMYSIADLQMATDSFNVENLIGEGSIGRVYQAQFDDGKVLAVKKIDSSVLSSQASEDFIEVVSNMARLHHTNVTELVGYCSEHGQHLLVYEFHKNGSLHDFLHLSDEYSKPLTWNTRVKIALGTARALEYLHEVCSPPVVHNNLKSANILLDMELNPHLSDCGLTNFIANADQVLNHNTRSGYTAPEVALSGQYATKSDIYSFGVIMLELLTGRKPFDSSRPRSEQSLVQWATPQLHDIDALSKMVDPALEGLYPVKSLSRFADVVALCVQGEPEFRPPMSEVVEALVRLVQRANMSKRTTVDEQGRGRRADDAAMDE